MYWDKDMEISDDSSMPLSSLLCQEDDSCFDQLNDDKDSNFNPSTISDHDVEYIEMLIQSETNFQSNSSDESSCDYSIKSDKTWFKCARLDAIQWILNVCEFFFCFFSFLFPFFVGSLIISLSILCLLFFAAD